MYQNLSLSLSLLEQRCIAEIPSSEIPTAYFLVLILNASKIDPEILVFFAFLTLGSLVSSSAVSGGRGSIVACSPSL